MSPEDQISSSKILDPILNKEASIQRSDLDFTGHLGKCKAVSWAAAPNRVSDTPSLDCRMYPQDPFGCACGLWPEKRHEVGKVARVTDATQHRKMFGIYSCDPADAEVLFREAENGAFVVRLCKGPTSIFRDLKYRGRFIIGSNLTSLGLDGEGEIPNDVEKLLG
jgi:hypothetical protein